MNETPEPPATSTTASSAARSGAAPYGPSTSTRTVEPRAAAPASRRVKPARTFTRKTSSCQDGAASSAGTVSEPEDEEEAFSSMGVAGGEGVWVPPSWWRESTEAIVNGCASSGNADTAGMMRYAVWPGAQQDP